MALISKSLRSPLGRARGLGSAKAGAHHWWGQRLTAIALIPLTVWLVYSLLKLSRGDLGDLVYWCRAPFNATLLILFVGVGFHHAQLGLQVVAEDYVSNHAWRTGTVIAAKFVCIGLAVLSIISILVIAFGR